MDRVPRLGILVMQCTFALDNVVLVCMTGRPRCCEVASYISMYVQGQMLLFYHCSSEAAGFRGHNCSLEPLGANEALRWSKRL